MSPANYDRELGSISAKIDTVTAGIKGIGDRLAEHKDYQHGRNRDLIAADTALADRLTRLEIQAEQAAADRAAHHAAVSAMQTDLSALATAASMGRGAWLTILKIGSAFALIAGLTIAALNYLKH